MALIWNSSLANVLMLVCMDLLLVFPLLAATSSCGLRLTGGQSEVEGRLEIEYSLDQWGSICNDRWDWPATFVACGQLGLGPPLGHQFLVPTDFSIPIVYDDVVCRGNESRLIDCSHAGVRNHDCTHLEDVTIRCAPRTGDSDYAVETVSIETLNIFTLIYYKTSWYTLCQSPWSRTSAVTLCHQLGFSQPDTQISFTTSVPSVFHSYECLFMYPVCNGRENHLRHCRWIVLSSSPPYLDLNCDAVVFTTRPNITEGTGDSRKLSPMVTVFLVLLGVVALLYLICKVFQHVQCEGGCCESCESGTTQEQSQQPQIQVISVRSLQSDEDVSLYSQPATEIQELPDDIPPSYNEYVTNPTLFRTFSEVRGSEILEPNSQAEDTVESPPPDYESATFGFPVAENESESSFDTRL